ncbi:hypothetical protein M1293_01640 [Candidatus Parvarchaeota archaeon]|nr:hypothetical protein [Candidatus Parvarchaeota archaeon]
MEEKPFEKLIGSVISNILGERSHEVTVDLDDVQLKLPKLDEAIKLSGKVTIHFSHKTGKSKR